VGLFSFIGKAIKGIAHAIPGVSQVYDVASAASSLLSHKHTIGTKSGPKIATIARMGTGISRGTAPGPVSWNRPTGNATQSMPTRKIYTDSPVMPGGAIATMTGVAPAASPTPPMQFGGSRAAPRRSAKRKKARSGGTTRKRASGRKLKFGSPAWRAKYVKKGRKKKR
jgi:hypothetical protein